MVGVLVQVVLGAYVVLTGLNPWSNMAHFLVSIFLVSAAFVLTQRVHLLITRPIQRSSEDNPLRWVLLFVGCFVLFLGTVVTGAGPHSGSEKVTRIAISVKHATRMHSLAVWFLVLATVSLALRARKNASRWQLEGAALTRLLTALCAQGFIGYVQYFAGVPAPLVAVHVALSVIVWLCVLAVFLPASTLIVLD